MPRKRKGNKWTHVKSLRRTHVVNDQKTSENVECDEIQVCKEELPNDPGLSSCPISDNNVSDCISNNIETIPDFIPRAIEYIELNVTKPIPEKRFYNNPTYKISSKSTALEETDTIVDSKQKIFKCDICQKTYGSISSLRAHRPIHNTELSFKCILCNAMFNAHSALAYHLKTKHNHRTKWYECNQCDYKTKLQSNMSNHKKRIDHTAFHKVVMCDECDKPFADNRSLKVHKRIHVDPQAPVFGCNECTKLFSAKSHLREHLRGHSSEKPFKCLLCEMSFKRLMLLYTHRKVAHDKENWHQCDRCSYKTAFANHLRRHKVARHDEVFKCQHCEFQCRQFRGYKDHVRSVHKDNAWKYKCHTCRYGTNSKIDLGVHLKTHNRKSGRNEEHLG